MTVCHVIPPSPGARSYGSDWDLLLPTVSGQITFASLGSRQSFCSHICLIFRDRMQACNPSFMSIKTSRFQRAFAAVNLGDPHDFPQEDGCVWFIMDWIPDWPSFRTRRSGHWSYRKKTAWTVPCREWTELEIRSGFWFWLRPLPWPTTFGKSLYQNGVHFSFVHMWVEWGCL